MADVHARARALAASASYAALSVAWAAVWFEMGTRSGRVFAQPGGRFWRDVLPAFAAFVLSTLMAAAGVFGAIVFGGVAIAVAATLMTL